MSSEALEVNTQERVKLTPVAHVTSLHMYPVKALGRMDVKKLTCTNMGVTLPECNLSDR